MQIATLVFYAVASFFLGVIATANSPVIANALGEPARWDSPVVTLIVAATIAGPLFFLALALLVAVRGDVLPGAPGPPRPPDESDGEVDDALDQLLDIADRYQRPRVGRR